MFPAHVVMPLSLDDVPVHQLSSKRRKWKIGESPSTSGPWFPMSDGAIGFPKNISFQKHGFDELSIGHHAIQLLEGCAPRGRRPVKHSGSLLSYKDRSLVGCPSYGGRSNGGPPDKAGA